MRSLTALLISVCCLGAVATLSGSMNLIEPQQLTMFQPTPAQSRLGRIAAIRELLAATDSATHFAGPQLISLIASLDEQAAGQAGQSGSVSTVPPLDLLRKGRDEYRAGNYPDAARDLRDSAQGFMSPAEMQHYIDTGHYTSLGDFETALIYLSLAYDRMGRSRDAREPILRLQAAERVEPHYANLKLEADAADFEALASRLAPAMPLPPNTALAQLRGVTTTQPSVAIAATPPPPPASSVSSTPVIIADTSAASPTQPPAPPAAAPMPVTPPPPPPPSTAAVTPPPFSPPPVTTADTAIPAPPAPEPPVPEPPAPTTTASATAPSGQKLAVQPTVAEQRAAEQRRIEQETDQRIAAQRAELERQASDRIAAERTASEKAANERIATERAASERAANEKIAAARAESDRLTAERIASERAAAENAANEKIATARAESERVTAERIASERAAADRVANERVAAVQAEARRNLYTTLRQAEAFASNGEIDSATNVYTRLLSSPEVSRDTLAVVATGLYRTGDFPRAVQAFQKVGTFNRGEEDLRYYYAVSLYESGHYADAKRELACALPYIEISDSVTRYRAKIEGSADRQTAAR